VREAICPVCQSRIAANEGEPGGLCTCGLLLNLAAQPLDYGDGHGQSPPDEKKMYWRRRNAERRLRIIEPYRAGHRLLIDIGCGSGEMLLEGRRRFDDVLGFEVNRPLVAYAREHYGLPVREQPFHAGALPEAMAGLPKVFALSHVLEHLDHPLQLLGEIRASCAPGDLLYVEVPLHTGDSFRRQRYAWNLWNDEHLMLFSPASLRLLVERAGFAVRAQGERIFARGSESGKTRFRLLRQRPLAFARAALARTPGVGIADRLLGDYGYVVAMA
jgi:SAM-dependent methyltransferase